MITWPQSWLNLDLKPVSFKQIALFFNKSCKTLGSILTAWRPLPFFTCCIVGNFECPTFGRHYNME